MLAEISQPVVLDTTVLSNFASTGTVAQLVDVLDRPVAVSAVRAELKHGFAREYEFLEDALDHLGDDIALLGTEERSNTGATAMRERLDPGEAESLLGAMEHGGTLATDDHAARDIATEYDIPVTGSVGLLVVGIRRSTFDVSTANQWLDDWRVKRGYYAPVERIEEIL